MPFGLLEQYCRNITVKDTSKNLGNQMFKITKSNILSKTYIFTSHYILI